MSYDVSRPTIIFLGDKGESGESKAGFICMWHIIIKRRIKKYQRDEYFNRCEIYPLKLDMDQKRYIILNV